MNGLDRYLEYNELVYYDSKFKDVLQVWQRNHAYSVDDVVTYNGKFLRCTVAGTSSNTTTLNVTNNTSVGTNIVDNTVTWTVIEKSVTDWTVNTSYKIGDLCIYNNSIYRCNTAHTSAVFNTDIANWDLLKGAVIEDWASNKLYNVNQLVKRNGALYCVAITHVSTNFAADEANWLLVNASIQEFVVGYFYKQDEIVVYADSLYKCLVPHLSVAFVNEVGMWQSLCDDGTLHDFVPNKQYFTDSYILHNHEIYRARNDTHDSVFVPSNWELVSSQIRSWKPFYDTSVIESIIDFEVGSYIKNSAGNGFSDINSKFNFETYTKAAIPASNYLDTGVSGYGFLVDKNLLLTNDFTQYLNSKNFTLEFFIRNPNITSSTLVVEIFNQLVYLSTAAWTYYCCVYDATSNTCELYENCNYVTSFTPTTAGGITILRFNTGAVIDNFRVRLGKLYSQAIPPTTPSSSEFNLTSSYRYDAFFVDNFCEYDGSIYKCIVDDTSDTSFDPSKWKQISGSGASGSSINQWLMNNPYKANDLVIFDSCLYKCLVTHTSTTSFSNDISNWQVLYSSILEWGMKTYYPLGIIVMHSGALYQCIAGHTSTALFDKSKFALVETATFLRDWDVNTYFKEHELVLHEGKLYRAEASHISGNDFNVDLTTNAYWLEIYLGGGLNYSQIDAIGAVAPKQYNVALPYTNTFLLPPVEALKFKAGSSSVTSTLCDFNAGDANDFDKNELVEFNGVLKPKTTFNYSLGIPSIVNATYYIQVSKPIDFNDFKTLEAITTS